MLNSFERRLRSCLSGVVILCSVCLPELGCTPSAPPVAELPPPEVTVSAPVEKEFAEFLEFTGRIEAVENVEVRARVSGYLVAVNFQEGETVEAGDVLFEIDPRPYEAALKAAEAELAGAEAALQKARADIARTRQLYEQQAASQQQLDTAVALEAVASASVEAAAAALENARLDLAFTKVIAPVDGRVGRALITKGNLISPSQLDTPLTTIVSIKPIDVYFDVDERSLLQIQRRIREQDPDSRPSNVREAEWPVSVQLADEQDFSHRGLIDFTDNRVDPGTGTIRIRGRLPNDDEFLHPGLFVRVRVPVGESRKRLLVPERAVGTDQGQRFLLIVNDDNSTERRNVTLGVRYEGGLRVIEQGLAGGEKVVIEGIQRVRPPAPVTPKEIAAQEPAGQDDTAAALGVSNL